MTVAKRRARVAALAGVAALALAACGGGGPLNNPGDLNNEAEQRGQQLSFVYFQRCINPIFLVPLPVNACASSGCHDNVNGTGGALRLFPSATAVDMSNPALTPADIRATDMYKNFYSAALVTDRSSPQESKLLTKPQVIGLHGGGLIFPDPNDTNVKLIEYWITHPLPEGVSEFSTAVGGMFDGMGNCNTQ